MTMASDLWLIHSSELAVIGAKDFGRLKARKAYLVSIGPSLRFLLASSCFFSSMKLSAVANDLED